MIYERVASRSQWLSIIARSAIKELTSVSNGAVYRATLSRLLRDYSRNESIGELLEAIYSSWRAFLTVRPIQIKEEISALLSMVAKAGPRTVLEIGTANGGTLFLLSRVSAPVSLQHTAESAHRCVTRIWHRRKPDLEFHAEAEFAGLPAS